MAAGAIESPVPIDEILEEYDRLNADAQSKLKTAISMLEERLEELGESFSAQALRAYEGLELHPEIDRAAGQLFRDSHYSHAVADAVKALNHLVARID